MYIMSKSLEHFGFENDPWVHGRNLKEKMCISWNWLSSLDFSTFCILIILKGYCVTLKYPGTASIYLPVKVKAQRAKLWPRRQRFRITYSAPIINSPSFKKSTKINFSFLHGSNNKFQNLKIDKLWFSKTTVWISNAVPTLNFEEAHCEENPTFINLVFWPFTSLTKGGNRI